MAQEALKRAPKWPRRAPRQPKRPPKRPEDPRIPREGKHELTSQALRPERTPETAIRRCKKKYAQRGPKWPQNGPQDAPQQPPRGPEKPPRNPQPASLRTLVHDPEPRKNGRNSEKAATWNKITARVLYPQTAVLGPGWLHLLWAHPPNNCRCLVPDRSAPSSSSSPSSSHSSLMVLSSSSFSASYP